MNPEDSGAFDRALTAALAGNDPAIETTGQSPDEAPVAHPEFQDLAAYIDGETEGASRERLETHLAGCTACRQLAMEAALAVEDGDATITADTATGSRITWWRLWRPAISLGAAVLAVAVGLLVLSLGAPTDAERLAAAGVSAAAIESAGPALVRRAADALSGDWPRFTGFDRFLDSGRPVMRGASAAVAPVPLAPRWSIIDDERPSFSWSLDLEAAEYEVLVVDENEELIASFPAIATAQEEEISTAYPQDATPLEAGKAYAWKINARIGEEWVASPYVPFIRASLEEQAERQVELDRVATSPMLQAVVLAASGRHRPALQALQSSDMPHRDDLMSSILTRQHFSEKNLQQQLRRWTSD